MLFMKMIFQSVLFQRLRRNICRTSTGLHVVKKPATVSSQSRVHKEDVSASTNAHVVASFAPVIEPRRIWNMNLISD